MSALSRTSRSLPFWLVRGIRGLLMLSLALTLLMAGLGAWTLWKREGGLGALLRLPVDYFSQRAGFRLGRIILLGNRHAKAERLLDALAWDLGETLTNIDLAAAQRRIESLEWVASASLRRILPGTIEVRLKEEEAFVIWQRMGRLFLVNEDGEAFLDIGDAHEFKVGGKEDLRDFASLPYLVGVGALDEGIALLETLASYPIIQNNIRAVVWVGERRWDLHLDGDIRVRLPQEGAHTALFRLQRLYEEYDIFSRDVQTIDLRIADRIGFRLGNDAAMPEIIESFPAPEKSGELGPNVKMPTGEG